MTKKPLSFMSGQQGQVALHEWKIPQPKYLVLLVHGYGEHLGRYQYVAEHLTSLGACVFGPDHQGHGQSSGERVLIESFDAVVDDLHQVVEHYRQQFPALPLVVIGHSMGGMIASRFAQRFPDEIALLVLSGPLLGKKTAISELATLAEMPDDPLDITTLSRDPAIGEHYQQDPLVWHGPFKRPTLKAMQRMLATLNNGPSFGKIPTLWLHGGDDRLVLRHETQTGIDILQGTHLQAKIFPGARHEIFNETNKDEVLACVSTFIQQNIG